MQVIVEEDLRLRAGEFGIWSRLDDEVNDDNHLVIHRPEKGNWVTLQAYPSNRSIQLLYPGHEGAPPAKHSFTKHRPVGFIGTIVHFDIDRRRRT